MAPTMIITVTLGSSKQFSAGASAAPKFRAVVARLRTLRCEPPSSQPSAKSAVKNSSAARIAPLPMTPRSARKFSATISTKSSSNAALPIFASTGAARAAKDAAQFFTTMPAASGAMMSISSGRAMLHGSAVRPAIISGSANGMKRIVPAVSSAMSAAADARSPRAVSTSFGKKGAPAAPPSSISPAAWPRSSGMMIVSSHAHAGARTKFSASASSTKRTSRSGAAMARGVSVRPIAAMLLTRKTSTATVSRWFRSSVMRVRWPVTSRAAARAVPCGRS